MAYGTPAVARRSSRRDTGCCPRDVEQDQVRVYAAEMVLAIEHLHRLNVIHRDLKPENVLLGRDGHLRLTDYGLAKDDADVRLRSLSLCDSVLTFVLAQLRALLVCAGRVRLGRDAVRDERVHGTGDARSPWLRQGR